jgi:hypothetical protein
MKHRRHRCRPEESYLETKTMKIQTLTDLTVELNALITKKNPT